VGTQVGNGLDVTVKYIDDKTGNVASAKWNKLDKATQDQQKQHKLLQPR
jgi:hypothetical protein